jgi:ribosome-binding protein aMBF1 (putative translation factor)
VQKDPRLAEQVCRAGEAIEVTEPVELTEDSPVQAAASRLRQAADAQGITQSEIARRLDVSPAVINRVFKNPDRSRVSTLRRIAEVMGLDLHQILE